jgi:hypothetical protein
MPGFLVQVGAMAACPHQGQVSVVSSNTRVLMSGQPAATLADSYPIAACVFTLPNGKPQPCLSVRWVTPATRILINGQPAILQPSSGICLSAEQIPQGPPTVTVTQTRVNGL